MNTQGLMQIGWLWKRTYSDGHISEEFCKTRKRAEALSSKNCNGKIKDEILKIYCELTESK